MQYLPIIISVIIIIIIVLTITIIIIDVVVSTHKNINITSCLLRAVVKYLPATVSIGWLIVTKHHRKKGD